MNLSSLAFVYTGFGVAMPARHTIYTISPSPDSALAVEVRQGGLSHRKYLFAFEQFSGELLYDAERPLDTKLSLVIQVNSLVCRQSSKRSRGGGALSRLAVNRASAVKTELQFESKGFRAKPLRGFVVEGITRFEGIERKAMANIGFGVEKKNRLQVDADAAFRLSEWNLPLPHALFGLVHTEDGIVLHALLWGEKKAADLTGNYASQG